MERLRTDDSASSSNLQASHNLIGTNGDGVSDTLERNIISENSSWGIEISDPGTRA